jgi:flagellar biosynthetic protein FliO
VPPPTSVLIAAAANADAHVSMAGLLARLVISLLVVLMVIWGLAQIVHKRGLPGSRAKARGGRARPRPIDVISRQSLGKGQTLVTVRMDERVLLLGVTAQSITTLSELDPVDFGLAPGPDVLELEALPSSSTPELSAASLGAGSWSDRIDKWRALTVRR